MPEATTMMIINVLLGLVLAGVGWWVNNIWRMVLDLQKAHNNQAVAYQEQLSSLSLELAKNYPSRTELDPKFERLFNKLEEIQKEMRAR